MKTLFMKPCMLCAIFLSSVLVSCDNDEGYSLGEYWVGVATINAPETDGDFLLGHEDFSLTLDDGEHLFPSALSPSYSHVKAKNEQRAIVNFTLLSDRVTDYDHLIKINAISPILTKKWQILTADTAATSHLRGKLPIEIEDAWIGDGYVNIVFEYLSGPGSTHYINLIENREIEGANPNNGVWSLYFVRDSKDSCTEYRSRGIVAFKLTDMPEDVKTIQLFTKGYNSNEDQCVKLTFKSTATPRVQKNIQTLSNDNNLQ